MSVQNDRDIPRPTASESLSNLDAQQLFRNLIDRVDASGIKQDGAYQLLSQISLNTLRPIVFTETPAIVVGSGAVSSPGTLIIDTPPDKRICIFDLYLSLDVASDVKFIDGSGNNILGAMFAPNDGQGFVRNYPNGIILAKGTSLRYTTTGAGDHSIEVNYALI